MNVARPRIAILAGEKLACVIAGNWTMQDKQAYPTKIPLNTEGRDSGSLAEALMFPSPILIHVECNRSAKDVGKRTLNEPDH